MKALKHPLFFSVFLMALLAACAEKKDNQERVPVTKEPAGEKYSGKLFIIGGGDRTKELMQSMIEAAGIDSTGYVGVLPMSSEEPDSAFYYISQDIHAVSPVKCINLNFREEDMINQQKLDSLRSCRLIFITGGDQSRFMTLVDGTPIEEAIHEAFKRGALIAGTSAGAAVMSEIMITGTENFSPEYSSTYDKIWKGNAVYDHGLGLINDAIIDQHFVARSRYNRILSAMCDHPGKMGIGIDEETAILVEGSKAKVIGDSQVIVIAPQDSCNIHFHHLQMRDIKMDILVAGDEFQIMENKSGNKSK